MCVCACVCVCVCVCYVEILSGCTTVYVNKKSPYSTVITQ